MYKSTNLSTAVIKRRAIERRILKATFAELLAAGYVLSIWNGGSTPEVHMTAEKAKLWDAAGEADEDVIVVYRKDAETLRWVRIGSIQMVYGNDGYDLMADYSCNLEDVLMPVIELANKIAFT